MLNPEEIASREFLVALRGFDRDEVTSFLEDVAGDVDKLQRQVRDLEGKLEQARSSGEGQGTSVPTSPRDAFKALGEETTRILVAAEESATEIREKADTEARETVDSAQKRAREELDSAQKRAKEELDSARRQAREDVEEARRSANRIVTEAEQHRDGITDEIRNLEATRDRLVADLRAAVKAVHDSAGELVDEDGGAAEVEVEEAGEEDEGGDDDAESARAGATETAAAAAGAAVDTPAPADDVVADREHVEPDEAVPAGDENDAVTAAVARTPETEPDDEVEAVAAAADTAAPAAEAEVEAEPAADEEEHDAFELREQSLSGVRPGMLRRLKRALQDVQNAALDGLRRAGDEPAIDDVLPSADDLATVGAVGQMFLTAAYRAGLSDAAQLAGGELGEDAGDASRIPSAASAFRDVLQREVISSLRATLRAGIDAGEPETSLSERIGEVFRDLKGPVVESVVEEHLTRVYSEGAEDAWLELNVDKVVWLVGDEPRCPENRCKSNGAEGPVELGGEFPSGHRVPPAHSGCTCVLAPAER